MSLRIVFIAATLVAAVTSGACGGGATTTESAPVDTAAAAPEGGAAAKPAPARDVPEYREITLPAGTTLALDLKTAVGSDTSAVEDAVRATLRRAITVEGSTVLPAGTDVVGTVTEAQRSGRVKGRARVAFRFTSLRHDSERYDIQTETIARVAEATKGEDATKVAIGAGAGAALGAILGGGSGAAKGAAIGGAGGTGVVLATRGKEVRVGAGADLTTKLTAPLTVRVRVS